MFFKEIEFNTMAGAVALSILSGLMLGSAVQIPFDAEHAYIADSITPVVIAMGWLISFPFIFRAVYAPAQKTPYLIHATVSAVNVLGIVILNCIATSLDITGIYNFWLFAITEAALIYAQYNVYQHLKCEC